MREVQNDRPSFLLLPWGLVLTLGGGCLLAALVAWRHGYGLPALGGALALMSVGGLTLWAVSRLTRGADLRAKEAERRLTALLSDLRAEAESASARREVSDKENQGRSMAALDAARSELLKDLSSHASSVHQDVAGLSRIVAENEKHLQILASELEAIRHAHAKQSGELADLGESVHLRLSQLDAVGVELMASTARTFASLSSESNERESRLLDRNKEELAGVRDFLRGHFDAASSALSESSAHAFDALLGESREIERRILGRLAEEAALARDFAQSNLMRLDDAKTLGERIDSLRTELSLGLETSQEDLASRQAQSIERSFERFSDDAWLKDVAARAFASMRQEAVQEVEALIQIHRMSAQGTVSPLLGGWALDPVAMLAIIKLIARRKPRVVLECGSGTSTFWIGAALRDNGIGHLTTLEHLDAYAEETRVEISAHGLEAWVDVRVAELTQIQIGEVAYNWYSQKALHDISEIELLIVDGPPKASGPAARYPAIPLLAEKLADQALIVLDDTDRSTENKILKRWLAELPGLDVVGSLGPRTKMLRFSRGA